MFCLYYGYDTNILIRYEYAFLLFIIISLLIIIHVNGVNCINVREYHRYSLTINKSLS